jgi:hypothetical protein
MSELESGMSGSDKQRTGGRGGIRTHGTLAGTPVFKTGALNRSATLPSLEFSDLAGACARGKDQSPGKCRDRRRNCLVRQVPSARRPEHCNGRFARLAA